MSTAPMVDVQQFIDEHPFSRFQKLILILCFLIVAIDGFDTASIGFIAPAIRAEWHLTPASLAPLFAAGLFGLMSGALLLGPLADRFGRKPILIISVAFFGLTSLLSAYSTDLNMLLALRFLTGLGLGGAMPSAVTLTSEYCPQSRRSGLVTLMFCGFTIGSAFGGLTSAHLLASLGWRGVLLIGGVLPLILLPFLFVSLSESLRWLAMNGKDGRRIVSKIAPDLKALPVFRVQDKKIRGSSVIALFQNGLLGGTILLWSTFFMSLMIVYLLSSWLPTLLNASGQSISKASLITSMFQIGGTIGAILLGRWMDKFSPYKVLTSAYFLAAICIAIIGISPDSPLVLVAAVFGAGFFVSGSQVGINALAAAFYPTANRATGVSWASAIGRSGSIIGSMAGGLMLTLKLDNQFIFLIVAIPALLAASALFLMGYLARTGLQKDPRPLLV